MTTVLLAMTDPTLRNACSSYIDVAGHTAIALERPLSVLGLAARLEIDAVVADDSDLGRGVAVVAGEVWPGVPVVVVGPNAAALPPPGVRLPVAAAAFLDALLIATDGSRPPTPPRLRLDPGGRRALVDGNEVRLSGTEYRLLEMLLDRSPHEVSLEEALRSLWGQSSAGRGANGLRVHIRNLRSRLAGAGLRNAVQSRRGRGYALVLEGR